MSGNGTDLGHVVAMLQGVLQGQESLRAQVTGLRTELRGEIAALREGHGRKLDDLVSQIVTMRQALTEYHASVLGHGILITELDARLRKVEQHLGLPPAA